MIWRTLDRFESRSLAIEYAEAHERNHGSYCRITVSPSTGTYLVNRAYEWEHLGSAIWKCEKHAYPPEADDWVKLAKRRFGRFSGEGAEVRTFRRTVRAGGLLVHCMVGVARRLVPVARGDRRSKVIRS